MMPFISTLPSPAVPPAPTFQGTGLVVSCMAFCGGDTASPIDAGNVGTATNDDKLHTCTLNNPRVAP